MEILLKSDFTPGENLTIFRDDIKKFFRRIDKMKE
jgi:hypothetical protein